MFPYLHTIGVAFYRAAENVRNVRPRGRGDLAYFRDIAREFAQDRWLGGELALRCC
jgi:hypothetical protein